MKKILITGKGSYVGANLIEWLKQWPDQYDIDEISVRGNEWKSKDLSKYDSVLHVAGIAHVSTNSKMEKQYYEVNRDLTLEVANYAKNQGVSQFVFMSSIIVYGESGISGKKISVNTLPLPSNFYGRSKLEAEKKLKLIEDDKFKITIVRPPMIYGKNSKGNFPILVKYSILLPFFPEFKNERSMLYIDNLSEFLRLIIKNQESGIFFPQNSEYINTSQLIKKISKIKNKKIFLIKGLDPLIKLFMKKSAFLRKIFGDLTYEKEMSIYKEDYQKIDTIESIKKSI